MDSYMSHYLQSFDNITAFPALIIQYLVTNTFESGTNWLINQLVFAISSFLFGLLTKLAVFTPSFVGLHHSSLIITAGFYKRKFTYSNSAIKFSYLL
jgi:branched-subunit amino acid transport protein